MNTSKREPGPLIAGAGGVILIVSLFLPWADLGSVSRNGWELASVYDVFLLLVGVTAIAAALTGGRVGVFRPDVSLIGATDLLGVTASLLLGWLVLFDFPGGASRGPGAYVALAAAMTVAAGAGDYSTLRGAPMFPSLRRPG